MIRSKLAAIVCGLLAAAPAAAQEVCGPLTARPSFTDTTIVSANTVTAANGVPAFCEVQATISPVPGSKVGAVYRLPAEWNGKVLGIGGGGFAGNLRVEAAAEGLTRGYAVLQNDMGHPSPGALDRRSRSRRKASATSKASSTSAIARRMSRPSSAKKSPRGCTAARRSARTGKAARRAAGKGSRKCSVTPTTTTASSQVRPSTRQ